QGCVAPVTPMMRQGTQILRALRFTIRDKKQRTTLAPPGLGGTMPHTRVERIQAKPRGASPASVARSVVVADTPAEAGRTVRRSAAVLFAACVLGALVVLPVAGAA